MAEPSSARSSSPDLVSSVNSISSFLASPTVHSLSDLEPSRSRVLVLCGSAILPTADHVFSSLSASPALASTLVICGGIGHSTPLLYAAIRQHPRYNPICDEFSDFQAGDIPESEVLHELLQIFYPIQLENFKSSGGKVLVETRSTNCGANAIETRRILEENHIDVPQEIVVVQDPTMALRTIAGFQQVYSDYSETKRPRFECCPTFVPAVRASPSTNGKTTALSDLTFSIPGIDSVLLWKMPRFIDLLLGEIPRMRDDENGYGPRGKGFITHVDLPEEADEAWCIINDASKGDREGGAGRATMSAK